MWSEVATSYSMPGDSGMEISRSGLRLRLVLWECYICNVAGLEIRLPGHSNASSFLDAILSGICLVLRPVLGHYPRLLTAKTDTHCMPMCDHNYLGWRLRRFNAQWRHKSEEGVAGVLGSQPWLLQIEVLKEDIKMLLASCKSLASLVLSSTKRKSAAQLSIGFLDIAESCSSETTSLARQYTAVSAVLITADIAFLHWSLGFGACARSRNQASNLCRWLPTHPTLRITGNEMWAFLNVTVDCSWVWCTSFESQSIYTPGQRQSKDCFMYRLHFKNHQTCGLFKCSYCILAGLKHCHQKSK